MPVLFLVINMLACSAQVTGPVSGRQYDVELGCSEDMQAYKKEREAVTGRKKTKIEARDIDLECPPEPQ